MKKLALVFALMLSFFSQAQSGYFTFKTDSTLTPFSENHTVEIDTVFGSWDPPEKLGPDAHSYEAIIRFKIISEMGYFMLSVSSCTLNQYLPIEVELSNLEHGRLAVLMNECGATSSIGYPELHPLE